MRDWLIRGVAEIPATVHAKLLVAFLAMVVLLLTLGVIGLHTLNTVNRRAEELVRLQTKDAAFRSLQYEALAGTIAFSSAMTAAGAGPVLSGGFQALLRRANQFQDGIRAWRFVAERGFPGQVFRQVRFLEPEEDSWFSQIESRNNELTRLVTRTSGEIDSPYRLGPTSICATIASVAVSTTLTDESWSLPT